MHVSIIIPNYNGRDLLKKNLPSVMHARRISKNKISEIIIVDDASSDGSVDFVKEHYPEIRLIKHSQNRGFSSAVNTGIRGSKGALVCLLNSDVVPSSNFLEYTLPHFKNSNVFGVSLHEKGYGWAKGFFKNGFVEHENGGESRDSHESFWVSGGSAVYRRSVWNGLRGMDESLYSPFYWEDIDISYRAAKRGYSLLWEPKSHVVHNHESTVKKLSDQKRVARIRERNQLLFIWKNITSRNLTRRHIVGLFKRMLRHPKYLLIFLMAFKKLRLVLKLRAREKKESKVSDEAIFTRFT